MHYKLHLLYLQMQHKQTYHLFDEVATPYFQDKHSTLIHRYGLNTFVLYKITSIYSKTCLKRTLKGPENFSAKGSFRLIKVHYIQYKKLNQDMHVLN